ncbi:MAG: NAD-dependent epimerase/dehydratase family protein [Chloroflexota bacterium]|jgi:nucleoside-diphosphate-sugar epimerase|nr:NAD-dependent epimerase/dehydratase family protein [Chloroflexota bacterium]
MRQKVVLITGANGEIGHGLIRHLAENTEANIVALDVVPLDKTLRPLCQTYIVGDILDQMLLGRLVVEHEIATIYHLASILSTKAEYNPETAHRINVEGTMNLLRLAVEQSQWQKRAVKFIYPSSIAAYGIPSPEEKKKAGKVKEWQWNTPTTMYGCNKLYCEHLGRYYHSYYRQLAADCGTTETVDFRAIRFPGLISAETTPTGGTSDYGPEMLHSAAKGEPYSCFVRPDTTIPFMAMPDAVKALVILEAAPQEQLTQLVYNVTSFSLSAQEIYNIVTKAFPNAEIVFEVDQCRQKIIDTWPEVVDDSAACEDWGWCPDYDCERSFNEYLIPAIRKRYQ